MTKLYELIGVDGKPFQTNVKGLFGGYRPKRVYGKLDCYSAVRAIAKGGYVKHRVFFADEPTAIAAGYRPCAKCMGREYDMWKARNQGSVESDKPRRKIPPRATPNSSYNS